MLVDIGQSLIMLKNPTVLLTKILRDLAYSLTNKLFF